MSGSPPIGDIWLSLHLAALDLDQAVDESDGLEVGLDLHAASHAVHRALVALGRVGRPASWRPPRVVALTLDEAIVIMGVIEMLGDGSPVPSWLGPIARSSSEKLRARVGAVRATGSEGWADVLAE